MRYKQNLANMKTRNSSLDEIGERYRLKQPSL